MRRILMGMIGAMVGMGMVLAVVGGEKVRALEATEEWMYKNCGASGTMQGEDYTHNGISCADWCSVMDCNAYEENKRKAGNYTSICDDTEAVAMMDPALREAAGCDLTENDRLENTGQTIINVAIGVTGLLAVIAMIMGGVQMVTSTGDPGRVAKGKATVMYGAIALVVATMAAVIVNFVITAVVGS